MSSVLICDCETDGFLDEATRIWMFQIGDAESEEVTIYADQPGFPSLEEGLKRMEAADRLVFQNGLKFDFPVIEKFYPGRIRREQIYDTLVAARLMDPEEKKNSLKDWGIRLGEYKGDFTDFSRFSSEMVKYGKQDIVVGRKMYQHIEPRIRDWGESVRLEHDVAWVIHLQERNGFQLNVKKAVELEAELRQELNDIERELHTIFPPMWVRADNKTFVPKRDDKKRGYVAGCPITKIELQTFNPGSRAEIAERFRRKYGWKPTQFTETGAAKIDEEVLGDLDFPEARPLLRYFRIAKQLGQIADGKNGWLKLVTPAGRVHGRVNPNGACTGRMAHFHPNMAQVDKKDLRMREVWEARDGWKLVGCDAEGLEARMLAHYLWTYDNGALADKIINGRKEDKTDIHGANFTVLGPLGLASREGAKTILYALMYGAGDWKLGKTLQDNRRDEGLAPLSKSNKAIGKAVRAALARSMVGIDKLTNAVKAKAKSPGYVRGLDGRRIYARAQHSALNTLLQGAGAIVMKKALQLFHYQTAPSLGWVCGVDFAYCANVHDEVQIEARPEIAEEIGAAFAECIKQAGLELKVRCPLAGAFDVGANWKDTH